MASSGRDGSDPGFNKRDIATDLVATVLWMYHPDVGFLPTNHKRIHTLVLFMDRR